MFLDRLDKAILRELQLDSEQTNLALADKVGLSAPACLKRVKRLKSEGVIAKQVALLNPEKLGSRVHMIVDVMMERDRKDLSDEFVRRVQKTPEVKTCYRVTGEVDFILIIEVSDMLAYEDLCQNLLYNFDNMKAFRTHISMHRPKYDTAIELNL